MRVRRFVPTRVALGLLAVAVVCTGLQPVGSAGAAPPGCTVSGQAFGATANVAPLLGVQPVALVTLPPGGGTTVVSVAAAPLVTSGTVTTSTTDASTATEAVATSTARVEDVSLLGGLITATAVQSVSTSGSLVMRTQKVVGGGHGPDGRWGGG